MVERVNEVPITEAQKRALSEAIEELRHHDFSWVLKQPYNDFRIIIMALLAGRLYRENIPYTYVYEEAKYLCDQIWEEEYKKRGLKNEQ